MTIGGVDTYYDYDERQWKYRRLGGGPVRHRPARPAPSSRSSAKPPPKTGGPKDETDNHARI